uniref:Uncharacterized protein n=1 Tax=Anguilla anguilla TaxID=7936 RepID=A0A0E9PPM9_ANGAN
MFIFMLPIISLFYYKAHNLMYYW